MEILEMFPLVFCFPKSCINENSGNWMSSSQGTSFKLGEYNLLPSISMLWFRNCVKMNFGRSYLLSDCHRNTVISDCFAYLSRWCGKLLDGCSIYPVCFKDSWRTRSFKTWLPQSFKGVLEKTFVRASFLKCLWHFLLIWKAFKNTEEWRFSFWIIFFLF